MKNKKYFPLAVKINFFILVILVLVFTVLYNVVIRNVSNTLYTNAQKNGNDICSLFAKINRNPLQRMDYYSIENNTKEILKNTNIIWAQIYDSSGFPTTHIGRKPLESNNIPHLTFKKDISFKDEIIGTAEIKISYQDTINKISSLKINLFIIAAITVFLLFLIIFALTQKMVITPLNEFVKSVRKISSGHFEHKAKIFANDEIGKLANHFNKIKNQLKNSIALINNIIESLSSMIVSINDEGIINLWNSQATSITGIPKKEAIGKNLWELCPLFNEYKNLGTKVIKEGKPQNLHRKKIEKNPDKLYNISFFPLAAEGLTGLVIKIDDITESESLEKQLRHAQKMETIGTLAGGLAHDFNNILSGIVGAVSIMKYQLENLNENPDLDYFKTNFDSILQSTQRASDMIKQLLSLSKRQDISFQAIDLNSTLKHVYNIAKNSFDKSVSLDFNLKNYPLMTKADPTQLEQTILNLCVNATHAMTIMRESKEDYGGTLSINFDNIFADEIFIKAHDNAKAQEYWVISISDTGVGMKPEIKNKIFEPFFTTKDKNSGTGLGLAMVYNIIKQHDGFIEVFSELNVGTTFNLYLPVLEKEKATIIEEENQQKVFVGEGKILVVDDEPLVIKNTREMLNMSGYEVLTTTSGNEAIQIFKEDPESINLVILDIYMPKVTGDIVYKEIKKINPKQKVLISSALKDSEKIKYMLNTESFRFIQKPFTLQKLSKTVYNILYE